MYFKFYTDVNDCLPSSCLNSGRCIDLTNGFECQCVSGFDGKICQINIDECVSNNCMNNAMCIDGQNGYVCSCKPGFTGTLCEIGSCKVFLTYLKNTANNLN